MLSCDRGFVLYNAHTHTTNSTSLSHKQDAERRARHVFRWVAVSKLLLKSNLILMRTHPPVPLPLFVASLLTPEHKITRTTRVYTLPLPPSPCTRPAATLQTAKARAETETATKVQLLFQEVFYGSFVETCRSSFSPSPNPQRHPVPDSMGKFNVHFFDQVGQIKSHSLQKGLRYI